MSTGKILLLMIMIPNFISLMFVILLPAYINVLAFTIGWNVLLLPHLSQFIKKG